MIKFSKMYCSIPLIFLIDANSLPCGDYYTNQLTFVLRDVFIRFSTCDISLTAVIVQCVLYIFAYVQLHWTFMSLF